MAKDFSENLLFDEIVERSKRDGQDAEQDIGQRQIGDEAIRGRLYRPVLVDDKDDDVKNIIVHLHRRTAFQVVFFSQSPMYSDVIVQVIIEGRRYAAGAGQ